MKIIALFQSEAVFIQIHSVQELNSVVAYVNENSFQNCHDSVTIL
jgi:hypothetical protein